MEIWICLPFILHCISTEDEPCLPPFPWLPLSVCVLSSPRLQGSGTGRQRATKPHHHERPPLTRRGRMATASSFTAIFFSSAFAACFAEVLSAHPHYLVSIFYSLSRASHRIASVRPRGRGGASGIGTTPSLPTSSLVISDWCLQ
jgi:hypothetical protein